MRWDYLYRYYDRYTAGGFKKLLEEGFSCENTLIPYTPSSTGPGHSCIYTGSVPALNGIAGNTWYDEQQNKVVYCADDNNVNTVGSTSAAGKMSPVNLWANTITDELRLAANFRNKTIAIALKDRGSILPGGHTANAAYWFDNTSGGWISSTYYMKELPAWVKAINDKKLPEIYLKKNWNTLFPIATYTQSTPDEETWESGLLGGGTTFPHRTDTVNANKNELLRSTPYGNTYTFDMAKAAIENEQLGKHGETDFLALSFSSTDYVGHGFGPNSIEAEDIFLRLDKDLADFINYLDRTVGKGQYLFFLSADHGAAHVPAFSREHMMPAGATTENALAAEINDQLKKDFNVTGIVRMLMNYNVYLNHDVIAKNNLNRDFVCKSIIQALLKDQAVAGAFDLTHIQDAPLTENLKTMVTNGYNQKLSGDIQYYMKPQWFEGGQKGTTHGLWNPYDTHIPLVWYGWHVKTGYTNRETYMTDIAPTLAALLHIQMPNACIGKVIEEIMAR
jgi:predicted AlkP superfamily pyrophosphatase or phosphodiesterase